MWVKWFVWKVERGFVVRRKFVDGRKIVFFLLDKVECYNYGEMVYRFLKRLMER